MRGGRGRRPSGLHDREGCGVLGLGDAGLGIGAGLLERLRGLVGGRPERLGGDDALLGGGALLLTTTPYGTPTSLIFCAVRAYLAGERTPPVLPPADPVQALELCEADLEASRLSPAEAGQAAGDLGLGIYLYQPLRDFEAVPGSQLRASLDRAERALDTMAAVGVDTLLACSSTSPQAIDDDGLAATQLALLADRAFARGMRVAWEALSWATRVSDYRHGWQIVQAAAHPALGVCLDSFHILAPRHDPAGIRQIPGEKIFFAQLADAPQMTLDLLTWSRHHRCLPGRGDLDVTGFAGILADAGYRGPWSIEVFSDQLRAARPAAAAADCMRSLEDLEEALCSQTSAAPALLPG